MAWRFQWTNQGVQFSLLFQYVTAVHGEDRSGFAAPTTVTLTDGNPLESEIIIVSAPAEQQNSACRERPLCTIHTCLRLPAVPVLWLRLNYVLKLTLLNPP